MVNVAEMRVYRTNRLRVSETMSDREEFKKLILYGIEGGIPLEKCVKTETVLVLFCGMFFLFIWISRVRDNALPV